VYAPVRSRLEKIIDETPMIRTYVLRPEEPVPFGTGQFIELTLPGAGEAPFTPSSEPGEHETLSVSVMNTEGRVTTALQDVELGLDMGVRGPLGHGYPLEEFEKKDILVVGGGCGMAPLRSLIYALLAEPKRFGRVILRYGAKKPADLLYRKEFTKWGKRTGVDVQLTVDEGNRSWKGNVGVVTTILEDLDLKPKRTVGVVCGPPIMMKFATLKLVELGLDPGNIHLSMERNMSCGLGMCGHCRIGSFYVCRDGPVLRYADLEGEPELWA
jgi:NAD(P)H-flavin reductase